MCVFLVFGKSFILSGIAVWAALFLPSITCGFDFDNGDALSFYKWARSGFRLLALATFR